MEIAEEKVSFIHEMDLSCHRALILHGLTIHNSSRNDPSLYLNLNSGAQRWEREGALFFTHLLCSAALIADVSFA